MYGTWNYITQLPQPRQADIDMHLIGIHLYRHIPIKRGGYTGTKERKNGRMGNDIRIPNKGTGEV